MFQTPAPIDGLSFFRRRRLSLFGTDTPWSVGVPARAGQRRPVGASGDKNFTREQAFGQKDLRLVLDLDGWREVISKCRRSCMSRGYITNGGGTMSGHQATRDSVAVEDFLAELSKSLPFPEKRWPKKKR